MLKKSSSRASCFLIHVIQPQVVLQELRTRLQELRTESYHSHARELKARQVVNQSRDTTAG